MKRLLIRFLLCSGLFGAPVRPLISQTPTSPKPSSTTQGELDKKLMATLTWGKRGQGDIAKVRALLQQGASPNSSNSDGNTLTALMVAAQQGYADIVKLLLDEGARVNDKAEMVIAAGADGATGITALSQAAHSENLSIVKMLVEHGADIHALSGHGDTILEFATTNEIAQYFLDRGLDINARDKDGYTLLILSAEGFHRPSIAFLLEHGADPNAKTTDGTTALKLARGIRHPDDVELLKKAGAKE